MKLAGYVLLVLGVAWLLFIVIRAHLARSLLIPASYVPHAGWGHLVGLVLLSAFRAQKARMSPTLLKLATSVRQELNLLLIP